ncbi:MAG: hypothetical protein KatS3mg038_0260 [Candidatus Kapaibacterium sp.]|nr:MAG: hypothetical protein KatS3mg038_0260 [Candidatus Kapabacteria bacterium]
MKRSYAFWGMLCLVAGMMFLFGGELLPDLLRSSSAITTIGAVGIVALGVSLVVASRRVQTFAAIIAGACIAVALSMSILRVGRYFRIDSVLMLPQLRVEELDSSHCDSCGQDESDRERQQREDTRAQAKDTANHHQPAMDTTKLKSIY